MTIQAIREIIDSLKPAVEREDEDGCVMINNWAGGNIDVAYGLGLTDGEAQLADRIRVILKSVECPPPIFGHSAKR